MEKRKTISISDCCGYYEVQTTFIHSLNEHGLIELIEENKSYFVQEDELSLVEKFIHLHFDLDINMEGLEAISHLLKKMEQLQIDMRSLQSRLSQYE